MKTKYWPTLVIGGIILAMGMGSQIGNQQYEGRIDVMIALILLIFGVASVIFGFKLRKLAKKGIKDTKDKEGIVKISKENNKAKYCKWSIAALIFAFLGGWLGIILGIIALFRIKKNPNLRGKTEAIVAIIISFPMMFIWVYLSVLDPMAFLPEESQASIYCQETCLEKENLQNSYIESDSENEYNYICSCLDSNKEIISQYGIS